MNALAEFKDYYKHLDEMIGDSTKADLAALNCVLNIRYVFGQTEWSGVNSPLRRPQTPSEALWREFVLSIPSGIPRTKNQLRCIL